MELAPSCCSLSEEMLAFAGFSPNQYAYEFSLHSVYVPNAKHLKAAIVLFNSYSAGHQLPEISPPQCYSGLDLLKIFQIFRL